jgi:hypothetical protein
MASEFFGHRRPNGNYRSSPALACLFAEAPRVRSSLECSHTYRTKEIAERRSSVGGVIHSFPFEGRVNGRQSTIQEKH